MTFKKSTDTLVFSFDAIKAETEKAICLRIETNEKWCDGDDERWDHDVWFPKSQIKIEENNRISLPRWLSEEKDLNRFLALEEDKVADAVFEEKCSKYDEVISRAKAAGIKGIRAGMRYATILAKAEAQGIAFAI